VTHNGEQVDTDFATFQRRTMDAYTLARLGGSYRLNAGVELYARVENITDETYEEIIGYRGAPRAVYFGLRFRDESRR
jgi:vitamin B12 transporter